MAKKSSVWLTLMLCMLLPLVAACGSGTLSTSTDTSTSRPAKIALSPGENMYVLDGYAPQGVPNANQRIVVFHPGDVQRAYTLPAGLTSLDHRLLIAT